MRRNQRRRLGVGLAVAALLCLSEARAVVAADPKYHVDNTESMPPPLTGKAADRAMALHAEIPVDEESSGAFAATVVTHTVWAKVVGDEEYRSFFGTAWATTARAAMETADNQMGIEFGIDFVWFSSYSWDSSPDTARWICGQPTGLLEELQAEFPRGAADVVVGFSNNAIAGSQPSYGCQGGNHVALRLHGSTSSQRTYNSWVVLQHEFSHLFRAPDRYPDDFNEHQNDVMENPYTDPSFWCEQPGYQDHGIVYAFADTYD